MNYSARVILDSVSRSGHRLTTFEIVMPRIVLAEFNTHRVFSRNSASSRAIPINKMIEKVEKTPFIPDYWGSNGKGMSPQGQLGLEESAKATEVWIAAAKNAMASVKSLYEIGVHKQTANRLLEPFLWHTVLMTATELNNFLELRTDSEAQHEIRMVGNLVKEVYLKSNPIERNWHFPLLDEYELEEIKRGDNWELTACKISSGRCARVSYETHAGKRDFEKDIELHDRLLANRHWSPLEHVAQPIENAENSYVYEKCGVKYSNNFAGWLQYRAMVA